MKDSRNIRTYFLTAAKCRRIWDCCNHHIRARLRGKRYRTNRLIGCSEEYCSRHGGSWTDPGGKEFTRLLKKDGYTVAVVQNPTVSLGDDVATTKRTLANQNGPVILVGHSYGGAVITEAGNDPKVVGLFMWPHSLRQGRVCIHAHSEPTARRSPASDSAPQDGYLFLDKAKFSSFIRRRCETRRGAFMADSQVPWA